MAPTSPIVVCPKCGSGQNTVVGRLPGERDFVVLRRCSGCGLTFTPDTPQAGQMDAPPRPA